MNTPNPQGLGGSTKLYVSPLLFRVYTLNALGFSAMAAWALSKTLQHPDISSAIVDGLFAAGFAVCAAIVGYAAVVQGRLSGATRQPWLELTEEGLVLSSGYQVNWADIAAAHVEPRGLFNRKHLVVYLCSGVDRVPGQDKHSSSFVLDIHDLEAPPIDELVRRVGRLVAGARWARVGGC